MYTVLEKLLWIMDWIVCLPQMMSDFDENYVDTAVFYADSKNEYLFGKNLFFRFFFDFFIFFIFNCFLTAGAILMQII